MKKLTIYGSKVVIEKRLYDDGPTIIKLLIGREALWIVKVNATADRAESLRVLRNYFKFNFDNAFGSHSHISAEILPEEESEIIQLVKFIKIMDSFKEVWDRRVEINEDTTTLSFVRTAEDNVTYYSKKIVVRGMDSSGMYLSVAVNFDGESWFEKSRVPGKDKFHINSILEVEPQRRNMANFTGMLDGFEVNVELKGPDANEIHHHLSEATDHVELKTKSLLLTSYFVHTVLPYYYMLAKMGSIHEPVVHLVE